jgi:hypothetical protein
MDVHSTPATRAVCLVRFHHGVGGKLALTGHFTDRNSSFAHLDRPATTFVQCRFRQLPRIDPLHTLADGEKLRNVAYHLGRISNTKNADGSAIFANPTAGTFTTQNNRNLLRAPGQEYYNAALLKRFPIYASHSLFFRFDAFDFPNHPNWNVPNTSPTSSSFGKVTQKNGQRAMQASLRYSF